MINMFNILNKNIILKITFSILLTLFCILFCFSSALAVSDADLADRSMTVDDYFNYCKGIADIQFGNNNYDYVYLKLPNWDDQYTNPIWKYVFVITPKISSDYDLWIRIL